MKVGFTLNGEQVQVALSGLRSLLDLLRYDLGLTGTKKGCEIGECGTCTMLLDGEPVNACMVLAQELEGRTVVTVEGLACDERLHPVQEAFGRHAAAQCGFCTPGMVMSAVALLKRESCPTPKQVQGALAGNLCRCTGYGPIIDAVVEAGRSCGSPQTKR